MVMEVAMGVVQEEEEEADMMVPIVGLLDDVSQSSSILSLSFTC